MPRRARVPSLVAVGTLWGAHLALLDPLQVLRANSSEFFSTASQLLPTLVWPGLAVLALVVGVGLALPDRTYARALAVAFALAVLGWVQSGFLAFGYGVFDGRELERIAQPRWRSLDLVLWVAVITLAVQHHRRLQRFVVVSSLALMLGLGTAAVLAGRDGDRPTRTTPAMPPDGIFEVSRQRNVFHVLLDSFQTDMFQELVAEEELAPDFAGFTLYQQNMGVARWTTYALPAIFTGELYDGTEPYDDYYRRSMIKTSFHNRLFGAGFRVNLIYQRPMTHRNVTNWYSKSLVYGMPALALARREALQLLDISLFRRSPHLLRPRIYDHGNWFSLQTAAQPPNSDSFHQKAFFNDYIDRMSPVTPDPAYHFLHLMPPHPPYATLEDGSYAGEVLPQTRDNYKNEARGILAVFVRFLERLRDLGIYDDALILLHGDHGAAFSPIVDGREVEMPQTRVPALLVVKPRGATGPLRVSNAPTCIADIAATILDATGVGGDPAGRPVHSIAENEVRVRPFFIVDDANTATPVLTRFEIRGDVFDPESWHPVGTVTVARASRAYTWGQKVAFGLSGNAEGYRGRGWNTPSNAAEWTDGDVVELHFEVEPPSTRVKLEIVLQPYLADGKLERQRLTLSANGVRLAEAELTDPHPARFGTWLPAQVFTDRSLTLQFLLPDAASPAVIGTGGDQRELGIFVYEVIMTPEEAK